MLTVSGLSKSFGGRTLYDNVTFRLSANRRIALLGGNGVGKTTLLEIVVGLQEADKGEVSKPKDYRIGYLPQELLESWHGSVLEEVMKGAAHILEIQDQLRELEVKLASKDEAEHAEALLSYGELQTRFETLGGYQIEPEARRILGGLGFSTADMDAPLKEMSGGWQMRASLARLLLQKPDVLVLDEPTNHLDLASVAWLEDQLAAWPGAILFVSHDRDFIEAVAERVIELAWGEANEYVGGFADFIIAREERIANLESQAANQARQVAKVERFIERFRYKATKSKQVQSRIKSLEKLDHIKAPKIEDLKIRFAFPEPNRSSRVVLQIQDASVGYGKEHILTNVNMVVERGQKIAFVGPNGAGKSTLLKAIMGQLSAAQGAIEVGANVDIAYFAQHHVDALDLSKTVEQEFRAAVGEQPNNRNIRTVLGSFGFPGESAERKVGDLSGGERTRLALAETMCNPVNLLVLDEPTNHLDLKSCDVLEDALRAYPGTVLLVSHDRYLIRNIAEQIFEIDNGSAIFHESVEDFFAASAGEKPLPAKKQTPKNKISRKEQRRAEAQNRQKNTTSTKDLRKKANSLERKALKNEQLLNEIEKELADPETYNDKSKMDSLLKKHDEIKSQATLSLSDWEKAVEALTAAEQAK